jgi:hypothetical protein
MLPGWLLNPGSMRARLQFPHLGTGENIQNKTAASTAGSLKRSLMFFDFLDKKTH